MELAAPAIFYADPFPFFLLHTANPSLSAASEQHGLVAATEDGRLLHWHKPGLGARQLTSLVPRGKVRLVSIDEESGVAFVVVTRRSVQHANLVTADLASGRCTVIRIDMPETAPTGVFVRGRVLYLAFSKRIDAFDLFNGRPLSSCALTPPMHWDGGRFVHARGAYYAIAYDGSPALTLEPLRANPATLKLFDREGFDSPWAVLADSGIIDDGGRAVRNENIDDWDLLGISADGHRLRMRLGTRKYVIDLRADPTVVYATANDAEAMLTPQIYWSTRAPLTPRTRFHSVSIDNNRLSLRTSAGESFALALTRSGELLLMYLGYVNPAANMTRTFSHRRLLSVTRCKMSVASWNDGSTAWLDGRGLLHLKSSDRALPELSIVLSTTLPAAWSSEGKVCGPAYFIGDAEPAPGSYFEDLIQRFMARLR